MAKAMLSIPACKGIEFGSGFLSARMKGSSNNDLFVRGATGGCLWPQTMLEAPLGYHQRDAAHLQGGHEAHIEHKKKPNVPYDTRAGVQLVLAGRKPSRPLRCHTRSKRSRSDGIPCHR
jgi:hypothetical protein